MPPFALPGARKDPIVADAMERPPRISEGEKKDLFERVFDAIDTNLRGATELLKALCELLSQ